MLLQSMCVHFKTIDLKEYKDVIAWISHNQTNVTLSTCRAEYLAMSYAYQELISLDKVLRIVIGKLMFPITVWCDNISPGDCTKKDGSHKLKVFDDHLEEINDDLQHREKSGLRRHMVATHVLNLYIGIMAYEHVNPEVELKVKEEDLKITEEFIEPNGNIIARETGRTYYEANNMKLESDVGEKDRNESQEKFECCLCEFSTIWIGNFRRHVNIVHFNKKDFKCRLCDYISSDSNTVLQHMSDVHFKLKKFQCHLCGYSTSRKTNLKRHITTVHLNLKKFKCEECAYATNLSSSLKYHIQKVHSDTETYPKPRNYKCNVCELSTTSKKDLNKHIKSVHLKIKDYQCDICEYKASRKTHLKSHMENIHSTKKFKLCDFSTTEQWILRRHVKDLHPEKL
ncbi:RE1-silencing transcription factor A-like [Harmonia axyridis]|uniref:RE1-silencing transcription factor A-like n=1 Tax=Harmonia axyridis TaxID=115357 RepID=UPI001E274EDE|nr:RE1-silencing transcription factor A-like [Harmonia axyridis]